MIKVLFCLRRRPELSREEFLDHWARAHGPLVVKAAAITGLRRYIQNWTVTSRLGEAGAAARGTAAPYDGVAEAWIDETERQDAMGAPVGRALLDQIFADEKAFIDMAGSTFFTVEEHVLIGRDESEVRL